MEDLRKRLADKLKLKASSGEEIKLTYFGIRGRAEISRLILAHAGVKFDDIRLTGEEFAEVKALLPYGSLPILEHRGAVLCESMAIAKYLAEECGLAGQDNLAKAQADEVVMAINGMFESIGKFMFAPEAEKAALKKKFCGELLPKVLGQLEARLCQRGGQFLAGNRLSYADLMVVALQDALLSEVIGAGAAMERCPRLTHLYERMVAMPNIKQWRGARPVDPMLKN